MQEAVADELITAGHKLRAASILLASFDERGKLKLSSRESGQHFVRFTMPNDSERMNYRKVELSKNVIASVSLPQGAKILDVVMQ